jgi:hypothetical protein
VLRCQAAHIFHFAKEPFNLIAHGVDVWVVRIWNSGV